MTQFDPMDRSDRKFKILTLGTVKRVELHHSAKFRRNRLNRGRDMAIFQFFKMAAILDFRNFEFSSPIVTQLSQSYPWPERTRWLNFGRSRSKVKVECNSSVEFIIYSGSDPYITLILMTTRMSNNNQIEIYYELKLITIILNSSISRQIIR